MNGMFLDKNDRWVAYMNFGFLCSTGVLASSPFPTMRKMVKDPEKGLTEVQKVFKAILRHYEGSKLPYEYERYYNAWYEFAQQHESNGNRLRKFASQLRGRRRLNREQTDYLSDLSTFFCKNTPDIGSLCDRVA